MNKQEIKEWIKSHRIFDWIEENLGMCGEDDDREITKIYEDGDKLFALNFFNGSVCEKWENNQYVLGCYEPVEVVKKVTMIPEITYEPVVKGGK